MKLSGYIVRVDTGFAPNPFGRHCTLACCKPTIRRVAEPRRQKAPSLARTTTAYSPTRISIFGVRSSRILPKRPASAWSWAAW